MGTAAASSAAHVGAGLTHGILEKMGNAASATTLGLSERAGGIPNPYLAGSSLVDGQTPVPGVVVERGSSMAGQRAGSKPRIACGVS